MDGGSGGRRERERRDAIVARVMAEQAALDAEPRYGHSERRRVRWYLLWIWPAGMAIGLTVMYLAGWGWLEGIGFGVSLVICLFYIGYVLLAERDDGRIDRNVRRLAQRGRAKAEGGAEG